MILDHTQEPPPTDCPSVAVVLDALGDSGSPEIPLLTEKLDMLRNAGLVTRPPLDPPDGSVSKDTVNPDSITVSPAEDRLSLQPSSPEQRPLIADGGQVSNTTPDGQKQLRELFCDVTGTDEVTEQQKADDRRFVRGGSDDSLAGDVADVAREDGLDDTLPKPGSSDSE